jgi:hypothetical protein
MGMSAMRAPALMALGFAAVCMCGPAMAATSTPYAKGGRTVEFAQDVEKYRRTGERFRITGHCQSACTMFLALPNVCIEPSARLQFHAGAQPTATQRMMNSYNAKLRAYLTAKGAMETPAFHAISGRDMIGKFGYRRCP